MQRKENTHNSPSPNTKHSKTRCPVGNCRDMQSGIGIKHTTKSVVMLMAAAVYHMGKDGKHRDAQSGSIKLYGIQANDTSMLCITFQTQAKTPMKSERRCSQGAGKMRRYCRSRLSLTKHRAHM